MTNEFYFIIIFIKMNFIIIFPTKFRTLVLFELRKIIIKYCYSANVYKYSLLCLVT